MKLTNRYGPVDQNETMVCSLDNVSRQVFDDLTRFCTSVKHLDIPEIERLRRDEDPWGRATDSAIVEPILKK